MKPLPELILLGVATLLVGPLFGVTADLALSPEPAPGVFAEPVTIVLPQVPGLTVEYRFLDAEERFLPWTDPLLLSALPGESRDYTLRLQTSNSAGERLIKDFRYRIVRPAPALPSVRPSPGLWEHPVLIEATLPEGTRASLDGRSASFPLTLEGVPGERTTYRFDIQPASAKDPAYPPWVYVVDRRGQTVVSLDVLSPVAGSWANKQLLAVHLEGLEQVFWSWGEAPDVAHASLYQAPVLLEKSGPLSVTVWGKPKAGGSDVVKTVRWTSADKTLGASGLPEAGVWRQDLTLPVKSGWQLSLDDGKTWRTQEKERLEPLVASSTKLLVLQWRTLTDPTAWRGLYWMDNREPVPPVADYWGGWNPRLSFSGAPDGWSMVEWTAANGSVTLSDGLWGPSGSWKIPDGVVAATIVTRLVNGKQSRSVAKSFPESGWIRPEWEPWDAKGVLADKKQLPLGGRVLPRAGFQAVYEIGASREVPEPGRASPLLAGPLLPQVPLGSDRTTYVRFAWRDESGTVGPPTAAIPLRIDHLPPATPTVTLGATQVQIQGAEEGLEFLYAVSAKPARPGDSLDFLPGKGTLDRAKLVGGGATPWLHVQAKDASGNLSAPLLNVLVDSGSAGQDWGGLRLIDASLPGGGAPLASDAVLPVNRVTLVAANPDRVPDLYWTEAAELPSNWAVALVPAGRSTVLGIAPGERKTFSTWWNSKTATGWLWDTPRHVVFTLDQAAPQLPRVTLSTQGKVVRDTWTATAAIGQAGDRLTYTLTKDGTPAEDPTSWRALPWPGTLTLDVPDGQRATFRWRLAATSVSGLSREWPTGEPVVIDRTTPPTVTPSLDFFTYQTAPLRVELPHPASLLRMTTTLDGSVPSLPDSSSPLVGNAADFNGVAGQQTLYRFRVRPFSQSGTPGSSSDVYTVLVDLSQAPVSTALAGEANATFTLTGVPEGGLSSAPLQLSLSAAWGTLHYELAEGGPSPHGVEAFSPVFPGKLELTGSEGADRRYVLAVRSFSTDGRPLTPEARWQFRIDRSPPEPAEFTLKADSRRPEALVVLPVEERASDETVLYRWQWKSFPQGEGQTDWKPVNKDELRFVSPDDKLTTLTVETSVKDLAGNTSELRRRTVIIDRNVAYVDPAAPTTGDGSREKPAASLAIAVAKMRREGRRVLLLATGSTLVASPQDVSGFSIWGGLQSGVWETTAQPGHSTLTVARGFAGKTLLESYAGALDLHRLDFSNPSEPLETLVNSQNSRVILDQASWQSSSASIGWRQTGGSLQVSGMTALLDGSKQGGLFHLTDVDASIRDVRWTSQGSLDSRFVSLLRSKLLLTGVSAVTRKNEGMETFLWAQDSEVTATALKILAGDGSAWCTGFVLNHTTATLANLAMNLYASRGNTGFQLANSQVDLQKVTLEVQSGQEFNQGLRLQDSRLSMWESSIQIDAGSYQGGLSLNGGQLELGASRVALTGGGQQAFGLQTLADCLVKLTGVTWALEKKTAGKGILKEREWATGSQDLDSRVSGW
ncbi:MAG: hypothetical protein WCG80_00875 [Spirochaetales bacterium]